jgi:hypothetical protein
MNIERCKVFYGYTSVNDSRRCKAHSKHILVLFFF